MKRKVYRKRPRRYRRKRMRGKGTFARKVRSVINRTAETKFIRLTAENLQLYHNVGGVGPVVYGNLLRSDSGTNQNQRIGDTVFGKYLSLKLWISNKSDRPNMMYRILVISTPTDMVNTTSPTNLFRGYNGNKMVDLINTDMYGIVYQKYIRIESDSSVENGAFLHEVSKMVKIGIPLNRNISYQTDTSGTVVPKKARDCLVLCIIPYDAYGTLTTDNVASWACCGTFSYKDY